VVRRYEYRPPLVARHPAAWDVYRVALDRRDGPARLEAAIELSESVREIRLSGIRARHPELSPREVIARWVLEEYGLELPTPE
jgi:hypothetical protein